MPPTGQTLNNSTNNIGFKQTPRIIKSPRLYDAQFYNALIAELVAKND